MPGWMATLVWAAAFLLGPGFLLESRLRPSGRSRSLPERTAWAFAFGSAFLTALAAVLVAIGALRLVFVAGATLGLVAVLSLRRPRRSSRRRASPAPLFWGMVTPVLVLSFALIATMGDFDFGEDSYYWTAVARSLALGAPEWIETGESVTRAFVRSAPLGYGYLLSTAALIAPRLHSSDCLVVLGLLWLFFSACSSYAVGARVGRSDAVGAAAAVLYIGSYWSFYYLLQSVSRQGVALGMAPLLFLTVVRKGARCWRAPELYVLAGALWVLHAFTALVVLCGLTLVALTAFVRLGPQRLARLLGPVGTLGAVVLLAPGLYVLGRFALGSMGWIRFFEHPNVYRMTPWDPLLLALTAGPATLLLLVSGLAWWGSTRSRIVSRTRTSALWLTVFLVAVGVLHQVWYRSTGVALPPERYYLFYGIAALLWLGAIGFEVRASSPGRLRTAALGGCLLLVWIQLAVGAFYIRRMLLPRPELAALFDAARQVEIDAGSGDRVLLVLSPELSDAGGSIVRSVLAPRPIVQLPVENGIVESLVAASRDAAGLAIVERAPPPEYDAKHFSGAREVWLVDLRATRRRAAPNAVLTYRGF